MVSGGVRCLAVLAADFELQRGSNDKLRRLDRTAQFCAADVLIGRGINHQVVLLVLLLLAGCAHGLQVFEGCGSTVLAARAVVESNAPARYRPEILLNFMAPPVLGPHKLGAEGQQQ